MPDLNRVVAGLSCREVLADLTPLLDGELPADRVAALQAHVAGCDTCARFGGRFAQAIALLRGTAPAPPPPAEVAARVRAAVAAARQAG